MVYRSRNRIVADILEVARKKGWKGALLTEIIYGANLNFTQAKTYIDSIVSPSVRMLDEIPVSNRLRAEKAYRINDEGRRYLNSYEFNLKKIREVEEVMDSIKKSRLVRP